MLEVDFKKVKVATNRDIKRMLIGDFPQNLRTLFVARTFPLLGYKKSLHFSQVLEVDFKKRKSGNLLEILRGC